MKLLQTASVIGRNWKVIVKKRQFSSEKSKNWATYFSWIDLGCFCWVIVCCRIGLSSVKSVCLAWNGLAKCWNFQLTWIWFSIGFNFCFLSSSLSGDCDFCRFSEAGLVWKRGWTKSRMANFTSSVSLPRSSPFPELSWLLFAVCSFSSFWNDSKVRNL